MKHILIVIAGLALAGCDITFGADGPVITQSDSIISRVVPLGNRTAQGTAPTNPAPGAATPTPASAESPALADPEPRPTGQTFAIPTFNSVIALPIGVTRNQVNLFKAAVADAGCTITTREQRAAVQSQSGLNDRRIESIGSYLRRTGDLEQNSGSYRLTSGRCGDA